MRGIVPTLVSISLTPVVVNSSAVDTLGVGFEPSLIGVTPGDRTSFDTFDFSSADGFEVDFIFVRNTLSLTNAVSASSTFTYLVLLASMASSLISVFSVFVKRLENWFAVADEEDSRKAAYLPPLPSTVAAGKRLSVVVGDVGVEMSPVSPQARGSVIGMGGGCDVGGAVPHSVRAFVEERDARLEALITQLEFKLLGARSGDWVTLLDAASGAAYYHNTRTHETSWSPPPVLGAMDAMPVAAVESIETLPPHVHAGVRSLSADGDDAYAQQVDLA